MKAMLATKTKMTTTALLVVITMVGLASGVLVYRMQATEKRSSAEQLALRANEAQLEDVEFAVGNDADDQERLVGPGKEGRKEIKITDFAALVIHLPIQVSATRGDAFSVVINGDDNLLDIVKVDKEGSVLKLSDSKARRSWQTKTPLKATITMPVLERVNLDRACRLTIKDFKSDKEFKVNTTAASSLEGSIEAGDIQLDAGGASRVKLNGRAKQAALTASGACTLQLEEFTLETVSVKLTGASRAAVNVKTKLDYSLDGASNLRCTGNPSISTGRLSGASSVSHK